MKIKFACPQCGKAHAVDSSLGGKTGRCKDCGATMRVPRTEAPQTQPPTGPQAEDLYGLDEADAAPAASPRAAAVDEGPASAPRLARRGTRAGGGRDEPWGLGLRSLAVKSALVMTVLSVGSIALSAQASTRPAGMILLVGAVPAAIVSVLLTTASVAGAALSLMGGNRRAFAGTSGASQAGWAFAVLAALGATAVVAAALPTAFRSARQAQQRRDGQAADPTPVRVVRRTFGPNGVHVEVREAPAKTVPTEFYVPHVQSEYLDNQFFAERFEHGLELISVMQDGHYERLLIIERRRAANLARLETMLTPKPEQAHELREQWHDKMTASLRRIAAAMDQTEARIRQGPESPYRQPALDDVAAWRAKALDDARALEAADLDDLAWLKLATTPRLGERQGQDESPPTITPEEEEARKQRLRGLSYAVRHLTSPPSSLRRPGIRRPGPASP